VTIEAATVLGIAAKIALAVALEAWALPIY
jgi:hypothetical protein